MPGASFDESRPWMMIHVSRLRRIVGPPSARVSVTLFGSPDS